MTNINYLTFISIIESFALSHFQVKAFHSDFLEQLPNFGSSGTTYPLLYVVPVGYNFTPNPATQSRFNRITVNVYCIDLILNDRANIPAILNTTSCILNDLFKWLTEGYIDGVDVVSGSSLRPLNNYTMESCAGWMMTLTVDLNSYSVCDIPWSSGAPVLGPTGTSGPQGGGTGGGGTGGGGTGGGGGGGSNPAFSNWRLRHSAVNTTYVPTPPGWNVPDCEWQRLPGTPNVDVNYTRGAWWYTIPFQGGKMIRYYAPERRVFRVENTQTGTMSVTGPVEYGYEYQEGGITHFTGVLGTGVVTQAGQFHPDVNVTFIWAPRQLNDHILFVHRRCGETPELWTMGAFNTTIIQIPPWTGPNDATYTMPPQTGFNLTNPVLMQPIQGYLTILTSTGQFYNVGHPNNPNASVNAIGYGTTGARNFSVAITVAFKAPTPINVEYSWRKEEAGVVNDEQTPQASGAIPGGGVAHAPVTFTTTWSPTLSTDTFSVQIKQTTGPQTLLEVDTFDVTITQLP
jgi:hypothetical protein